jgi:hypothetical protein
MNQKEKIELMKKLRAKYGKALYKNELNIPVEDEAEYLAMHFGLFCYEQALYSKTKKRKK